MKLAFRIGLAVSLSIALALGTVTIFVDKSEIAGFLNTSNSKLRQFIPTILAGAAISALLGSVLAFALVRRLVSRPVAEMTDMIGEARHGTEVDLSRHVDLGRRDELGTLAREIDEMARSLERTRQVARAHETARRRLEKQLEHTDRLATIGELASGVAHEIGTPLQSITIRTEMLRSKAASPEDVLECADDIKHQVSRAATIVRNMLRFSGRHPQQRSLCDLRAVVENAIELVEAATKKSAVEIVSEIDCNACPATVDERKIEQVITNLILNGIQAMPEGGRVTVGLARDGAQAPAGIENHAAAYFCIYVEDEGTGIPEDVLPHLFDSFFTTKEIDQGTGLGLSIAYRIVREHGGWIDVKTSRGRGSRFSFYLAASG